MEMKKRKRLTLIPNLPILIRSNSYRRMRWYWLNELIYIRAKCRNGTASKRDVKAAQQALARVRLDP